MRALQIAGAIIFMLAASSASAQEEPEPETPTPDMPMMQPDDGQEPSPMDSPKMEHMADALASMAKTCEMMMKMEMAGYPVKIAAGSVLGVIATVALVLLVVLEVQWIRLLGLRIKQAKNE